MCNENFTDNLEKPNNSSGWEECHSCELPNFTRALSTQRQTKNQHTGLYQPFEASNTLYIAGILERIF